MTNHTASWEPITSTAELQVGDIVRYDSLPSKRIAQVVDTLDGDGIVLLSDDLNIADEYFEYQNPEVYTHSFPLLRSIHNYLAEVDWCNFRVLGNNHGIWTADNVTFTFESGGRAFGYDLQLTVCRDEVPGVIILISYGYSGDRENLFEGQVSSIDDFKSVLRMVGLEE